MHISRKLLQYVDKYIMKHPTLTLVRFFVDKIITGPLPRLSATDRIMKYKQYNTRTMCILKTLAANMNETT